MRGKETAWIISVVVLLLTNIFVVSMVTSNGSHPVARFTYSLPSQDPDAVVNQVITFDASSSTADGGDILDPDGYFWNFADGTTGSGKVVTHAYSWPSSYSVTLTVTDTEGLSDTTSKTIPVFPFLRVNPPILNLPIGSEFSVTVDVVQIINLYSWQFEIDFKPSVLKVTKFYWGNFLKNLAPAWQLGPYTDNTAGYVSASELFSTPRPAHGADGTGTLATITFQVKSVGATLLEFNNEKTLLYTVISGSSTPIRHERFDGIFDSRTSNQPPTALLTVTPSVANRGDELYFDASSSYDPDAWLVSYSWDYGNGTTKIYTRELDPLLGSRNINLTTGRAHKGWRGYPVAGVYTVTLTVTDNNGTTATGTQTVTIQGHDIAVTKVKSQYIAVMPGVQVTINVTVANKGYPYSETFNVTAYYNKTEIVPQQKVIDMPAQTETTLTFTWDTTDDAKGKYTLKANATVVEGDYDPANNEYIYGTVTIGDTIILPPKEVTIGGRTFYIMIETSSLGISPLDFSAVNKKITFTVAGKDGTTGFSNVTIPIDLLGGPYQVLFDGAPITPDPQETTNGTHTFLYFQYTHSTHTHVIEIIGTTVATAPIASFTHSPLPLVNKEVTFDASASEPQGEIVSYKWDFDDGTPPATEVTSTATHVYTAVGDYSVVLNVTDNKGLWDTETKIVTVYMRNIAITDLTVTPNTVKIGQQVTINITVANQGNFTENFNVTAYYDNTPIDAPASVTIDDQDSEITTIVWNTTSISAGTYTIKANATVVDGETETDDNTKIYGTVTIQKWGTQLSISAAPTIFTLGETTTISGTINITRSGVSITIQYPLADGTWNNITTVTTDAQGNFSHSWKPEKAGTYEIKARWQGDATTLPSESNTQQITVNEPPTPINFLYIVAGIVVIILMASAVYFLKIKKPKTT